MTTVPIIETERAIITVLTPDESELIYGYYLENRIHLAPFEPVRNDEFHSAEAWKRRIISSFSNFKCGVALNLVALSLDRKEMLAGCNFTGIAMGPFRAAYLGYSVAQKCEGSGLMFEVLSAGIKYVFEEMKLHRVMANHIPENVRSARLLNRLGFEREGYAKSYLKINGRWQDHVLNSLINPDPKL